MFESKENEKIRLVKDLLGERAGYAKAVKQFNLSENEKEIFLLASIEIKKDKPKQDIIEQVYDIVLKKSFYENEDDITETKHEILENKDFNMDNKTQKGNSKKIILFVSLAIICIVFLSQITLFVIQPIGAIPEGKTLVILRLNKTNFIDSADAMCIRETGSLNLLCRGMMLSAVLKNSTIIVKLPYSRFLYDISTNGKEFSR